MGPLNVALCGYGGGTMGRNPYDWMEMLRRTPHGRRGDVLEQHARKHRDPEHGDRTRREHARRQRRQHLGRAQEAWTPVKQVEWAVEQCRTFGRKVATADEARKIMKVGVWYDAVEETLFNAGASAESRGRPSRLPDVRDQRQASGAGRARTSPVSIL